MKVFIYLWLLLFLSCNPKSSETIDPFFEDLEKELSGSQLFDLFINAELDVFLMNEDLYSELFSPKLFDVAKKHESEIKLFLKSNDINKDSEEETIFFLLLFQRFLNQVDYNERQNLLLAKQIVEKIRLKDYYLEEFYNYQVDDIIDLFRRTYNVGELITLIFPLDYDKKYDQYSTYMNPFPASLDFCNASDTLFLKGYLINIKEEELQENSLIIQVKISENSHPDVFVFDKYYSINDTFSINIRDYARPPYEIRNGQ